jgi:hypothetical protein
MANLNISKYFTEEDIKFNREMVDQSLGIRDDRTFLDSRGGKMLMTNRITSGMFNKRNYDFTSDTLGEFRRKWGLHE